MQDPVYIRHTAAVITLYGIVSFISYTLNVHLQHILLSCVILTFLCKVSNIKCGITVSSVHEKDLSASTPPTSQEEETPSSSDHNHPGSHELPHVFIGVSMALGFVFMLLVDQLAGSHHSPNPSGTSQHSNHIVMLQSLGILVWHVLKWIG